MKKLKEIEIDSVEFKYRVDTIDFVKDAVLEGFEVNVEDFHRKCRKTKVVNARKLFFVLVKQLYPEISKVNLAKYCYEDYDHSSVIHAMNKHIEDWSYADYRNNCLKIIYKVMDYVEEDRKKLVEDLSFI